MEENKDLQTVDTDRKEKKSFSDKIKGIKLKGKNSKRPRLIKNQALLKRGGYAVAFTSLVLVAIVIINVLVTALANRFNLEFDMTTQKVNTISEENIEYIKNVDAEIEIIVCANEDDYAGNGYMDYYAQNYYQATGKNVADYYQQTINLINKYDDYNDKITVRYIDPQTTEFTEITTKYPPNSFVYGDIVVTTTVKNADGAETERHKWIGYEDIYNLSDESGYAAMGYGGYTVSSNGIETALTSAIEYVASGVTKKVALLTGHSAHDYTSSYTKLLTNNNYEVVAVEDSMITKLSDEYDAIVIAGPATDFLGSELDVISEFLDNDGNLGKGLLFFADASNPALPNLYEFLEQWGIKIGDGVLFETTANYMPVQEDPSTLYLFPSKDDLTSEMSYCVTGYNVPMTETDPAESSVTVTSLYTTSDTAVAAPVGAAADWKGYNDDDLGQYHSVLQAEKLDYNDDNEEIASYVMAFSSVQFITSDWAEYSQLSNKNVSLVVTERAAGTENSGISFVSKTITDESYADSITAAGSSAIMIIFMILLPIAMIIIGIVIFIRRRNA